MLPQRPLTLWRITDGKPGHEKQTLGLCQALLRQRDGRCFDVDAGRKPFLNWLSGQFPAGGDLPPPDLIIGAGHATHFALLAARRAFGGRCIVLMQPSLPLAWFDLCLIPRHDRPPARANVVTTLGALNTVQAGERHDPGRGLILVGGPSSHYQWDDAGIASQILALTRTRQDLAWTLSDSRRTPPGFLDRFKNSGIICHPHAQTPAGWLETELARASEAWVSPDSVSMVYEALTAGCRVGVFDLPAMAGSRVAGGLAELRREGYVCGPSDATWPSRPALNEAERCAHLILERWFR
jgi:mitochondrial fission protein ELM1